MTGPPLSRAAGHGRPAAPVRLVHLGLGNFFRAHQAWCTDRASDAPSWGYAAFTGRHAAVADALTRQQGLYTVVLRAADGDRFDLVGSLSEARAADDHDAWLRWFRSPDLGAVTVTVTEVGYLARPDGRLDAARPEVVADVATLRRDTTAPVRTAAARLVAGLAARRRADGGPIALVPCDNVPGNGALAGQVVRDLAEMVDPDLADWVASSLSVVGTVVDRITPRTTPADLRTVADATGVDDRCPVVCEPFHEWVLCGSFPAGRPRWEEVGAAFVDDPTPFEHRKLWLLNGAHSLLAYAGSIRGHATVAGATADDTCRAWLHEWWAVATTHLGRPAGEVAGYVDTLLQRFGNPRIADRLDRIAADGSQKLPVRVVPVLCAERRAGHLPAGAIRIVAAWVCHLRGMGAPVDDARADEVVPLAQGQLRRAVPRVLGRLDRSMADDAALAAAVVDQCHQLAGQARRRAAGAPR